jgi:hypothetical protein
MCDLRTQQPSAPFALASGDTVDAPDLFVCRNPRDRSGSDRAGPASRKRNRFSCQSGQATDQDRQNQDSSGPKRVADPGYGYSHHHPETRILAYDSGGIHSREGQGHQTPQHCDGYQANSSKTNVPACYSSIANCSPTAAIPGRCHHQATCTCDLPNGGPRSFRSHATCSPRSAAHTCRHAQTDRFQVWREPEGCERKAERRGR